jgi:uncharacterized phosphosugar-binding protein
VNGAKSTAYLHAVAELLLGVADAEADELERAGEQMARAIERGGLVHLFGSGHSMLPVLEVFPRYGSFVGLHPLVDPRLLWFNVLGSGGVPEMLFLQTVEGYATVFLDGQGLRAGDVLIVFSHSGTSAVAVEAAAYAKDRGLEVIGVLSRDAAGGPSRHSSGERLETLADLTIDTFAPRADALVEVDGLSEPVGAASTVVATAIALALVTSCADQLAATGHELVQSARGETDEHLAYRSVYEAYEQSLRRPA